MTTPMIQMMIATKSWNNIVTAREKRPLLLIMLTLTVIYQAYLSPVRKDLSVTTIGHKFVWKLGYTRVKVIHDHMHESRGLSTPGWVLVDWICPADGEGINGIMRSLMREEHLNYVITIRTFTTRTAVGSEAIR